MEGRYLGDTLTDELYKAIQEFDTDKIRAGDYFIINGHKWTVKGWVIPSWDNDVPPTEHHITLVGENIPYVPSNEDGTYKNSLFRKALYDKSRKY